MSFYIASTKLIPPFVDSAADYAAERITVSFERFIAGSGTFGDGVMADYEDMLILKHGSSAITVVDDLRQLANRIEYNCIK